jgi:hypothetical protein
LKDIVPEKNGIFLIFETAEKAQEFANRYFGSSGASWSYVAELVEKGRILIPLKEGYSREDLLKAVLALRDVIRTVPSEKILDPLFKVF